MKYFLILLFGCFSFFASAQEVIIPADVARYFLETHDRVKILIKKDSVNQLIVSDLTKELSIKQVIINAYQADSVIFKSILALKEKQDSLLRQEIVNFQKTINLKTFEVDLFAGGAVGAIIGSVIPGVGVLPGAVFGMIAGASTYGIKKVIKIFKR